MSASSRCNAGRSMVPPEYSPFYIMRIDLAADGGRN
jgi:hypothetical protein